MGFNIAEAINFATESWFEKIQSYEACKCEDISTVSGDVPEILDMF